MKRNGDDRRSKEFAAKVGRALRRAARAARKVAPDLPHSCLRVEDGKVVAEKP